MLPERAPQRYAKFLIPKLSRMGAKSYSRQLATAPSTLGIDYFSELVLLYALLKPPEWAEEGFMQTLYRLSALLTASGERPVIFEGSVVELTKQFPVEFFPVPLNGHVEDILGGRGGTLLYRLERANVDMFRKEPPTWQLATDDPRF